MSETFHTEESEPNVPSGTEHTPQQGVSLDSASSEQMGDAELVQRPPGLPGNSKPPKPFGPDDGGRERQALMRLSSAGFELASFSLILGGGGYAIDHYFGNQTPYVGIAGLLLGFSMGFYRLILLASRLS